ncbi:response regulator [Halomontanus rarus]|uniref:response regulator n=1 Tax=Halomontanus rarus TaxID=3034020 RepID=UPI00293B9D73|nr:response regulator [Halovivax sp. KZCA124]
MTKNKSTPAILLIEDNPGDIRLTQEAFREAEFDVRMYTATDGMKAIDFLRDEASLCPNLVLLDLNLPRKDGFEVLEEIKADPELEHLPVLVLTSSTAREDVISSYEQHANAYLTKPDSPGSFVELAQTIEEFWLERVRLPSYS